MLKAMTVGPQSEHAYIIFFPSKKLKFQQPMEYFFGEGSQRSSCIGQM